MPMPKICCCCEKKLSIEDEGFCQSCGIGTPSCELVECGVPGGFDKNVYAILPYLKEDARNQLIRLHSRVADMGVFRKDDRDILVWLLKQKKMLIDCEICGRKIAHNCEACPDCGGSNRYKWYPLALCITLAFDVKLKQIRKTKV